MWQQAGSASGFKNYVACELPQLLGTISDSTSVMQSLFSISLQVLQFCLADSSCVLQQWGTQFLLTFPSCYNTEQLSVFLQSMNAQHTYINRYCMYENLHLCIFLELESALWFHYPDFYIIHCLIPNVSICIHLHTNTCVSNIMQSKPLFLLRLLAALSVLWRLHQGGLCWAGNGWKRGISDFILQDEDRYFIADALQQIMDYMEESLRFWGWWQWRLSTLMHM